MPLPLPSNYPRFVWHEDQELRVEAGSTRARETGMADNPYDRRQGAVRARGGPNFGQGQDQAVMLGHEGRGSFGGVEFADLEAMVRSAVSRGAMHERQAGEQERRVAVEAVARKAWDEGHAAGMSGGHSLALERASEMFEVRVKEAATVATEVLEDRRATKAMLVDLLSANVALFNELVVGHHNGFVEVPF